VMDSGNLAQSFLLVYNDNSDNVPQDPHLG
jgi:hypothetical protein